MSDPPAAGAGSPSPVAGAYDAIAPRYDRSTADDRWMRRLLWRRYDAAFQPGQRVLDLGCGTGLDSLELARRDLRITALDVAPGMIFRLRAKLGASPELPVAPVVADAGDLTLFRDASFDGIVSSFAAVNTVRDWPALAAQAARVLRPGGRLVLHLLAPAGVRGGALEDSWRPVEIAGHAVPHRVRPVAESVACFAPPFRLLRARALGFLWPRRWGARLPLALAVVLGRLELLLGGSRPFRDRGRFQLLELERRSAPRRTVIR